MTQPTDYRSDANPVVDEQEIPEFVATKEELIHLAKYWAGRILDVRLWTLDTGQCNRWEWQEESYALDRIDRIAEVLPKEEVKQTIQDVEESAKKDLGDEV